MTAKEDAAEDHQEAGGVGPEGLGQDDMIIDVSRYNRVIDFPKAKAAGVSRSSAGSASGSTATRSSGATTRRAKQQGMKVGAYYVPKWNYDPTMQVEAWLRRWMALGGRQDGEVWIDCEVADGYSGATLRNAISDVPERCRERHRCPARHLHRALVVGPQRGARRPGRKDYNLWVAHYTRPEARCMPQGWTNWRHLAVQRDGECRRHPRLDRPQPEGHDGH